VSVAAWLVLIGFLVLCGALAARMAYCDGYGRGLTDGIEIEASLRENRPPKWSVPAPRPPRES
jgi:hypothetical protein